MLEIGGYFEFEKFHGKMLHEEGLKFDCGRSCLEFFLRENDIRKIKLPFFLCDSVKERCERSGVLVEYYEINKNFEVNENGLSKKDWIYLVNFYGQLEINYIRDLKKKYPQLILDNSQAYFAERIAGIDTIYSCRKFFGVSDGGILITDKQYDTYRNIDVDLSHSRFHYLLGRFEEEASGYYHEYVKNNADFSSLPMKRMSKLTENMLRGFDYQRIRTSREKNFAVLFDRFYEINELEVKKVPGPFCYPLYIKNGNILRKRLIQKKIYIPLLWPNVIRDCKETAIEFRLADDLLPVPCDHRYSENDMEYIACTIFAILEEGMES